MRRTLTDPLARLRDRAAAREAAALRRRIRVRGPADPILDLAGNDYLGLSRDTRVVEAGVEALRTWGAGSTGSRLVTGSTSLHGVLEDSLASHCGAEAALVFSSGYLANVGAVTALAGPGDVVISDAHNHASIVDACRLSRAEVVVVPHRDVGAVADALVRTTARNALVITDAVFSVDGDAAPVADLHAVAREHGALLVVDEAHAVGVVGQRGEGLTASLGLADEPDVVRTATLSKALGSQGGVVLGARDVANHLVDTARTFIFDTALAPAAVGAALASLRLLSDGTLPGAARARAAEIADIVGVPRPVAAVVPVRIGDAAQALDAAERLATHGVRVACFRPPTVPDEVSRLRITARADLTDTDIERLTAAVKHSL